MFLPAVCATLRKSFWHTKEFFNSIKCKELGPRFFSLTHTAESKSMKVAILGAGGRTGNALSFFLKHCTLIDWLALYDIIPMCHSSLELATIDTQCRVSSELPGNDGLKRTLEDSKIVMITAGKPVINEENPKNIVMDNAEILAAYITEIIKHCPRALVAIATSPINQLIPLSAEVYKRFGIFDCNRLFGLTTLDCVRANTFSAEILGLKPECMTVPVVGGCCPLTRVPLFSQAKPCNEFTHEEISKLTYAVRMGEEEVAKEYAGNGTSSLAMGFAAARFCTSLCKGLKNQRGVVECAYVRSCIMPGLTYFAGPIELGPDGIQKHLSLSSLTKYECKLLDDTIPIIKTAIQSGEELALGPRATSTEFCPKYDGDFVQDISENIIKDSIPPSTC